MQINFTIDFAKMNSKIKKHLPATAGAVALMGLALLFSASVKRRVQEKRRRDLQRRLKSMPPMQELRQQQRRSLHCLTNREQRRLLSLSKLLAIT